jgi:pimeloyl-ACP methyl ester carboxylesterase
LSEITVPTVMTMGGHDEVRPFCAEVMLRGIRNFELMIFEDSSHSAHLEDLDRYLASLPGCLARVDTTEAA